MDGWKSKALVEELFLMVFVALRKNDAKWNLRGTEARDECQCVTSLQRIESSPMDVRYNLQMSEHVAE